MNRPHEVLHWAVENFGPIASNRDERAARLAEEAIEVAQVEGVTLEALAANVGVDHEACAQLEWERVKSKPRDWWQRKHAEKVAAGTADLSPTAE